MHLGQACVKYEVKRRWWLLQDPATDDTDFDRTGQIGVCIRAEMAAVESTDRSGRRLSPPFATVVDSHRMDITHSRTFAPSIAYQDLLTEAIS